MAKLSLRRFDVQAQIGFILTISSVFFVLGMIALIYRNYDAESQAVYYNPERLYFMAVLAMTGLGALLSTVGALFGISSAGQRRNDQQKKSWIAFFLGTTMLSATLILFSFFWFLKERVV